MSVIINIVNGLRKKFKNSSLTTKTCPACNKEYPRDENYFYRKKHPSKLGTFNYNSYCIECENKRTQVYKSKSKEKIRPWGLKYTSSFGGYFNQLWQGVVNSRHGNNFKNFDEFFNCWEEQKKIFGMKCPILGIEMTMIKGKGKPTDTNISKDRILSSRPYSQQNVIFVSWKANNMKGSISPFIAKKYLEIVRERYGTDDPQ